MLSIVLAAGGSHDNAGTSINKSRLQDCWKGGVLGVSSSQQQLHELRVTGVEGLTLDGER